MPAQEPPTDIGEAPGSAMVLPEQQERHKRSANVVMYGLSGDSPACLRQAVQEVFQALSLPHAGQHVVAVEPLPTQGPHPPVVVRFDDPWWSARLLRSKRGLRRLPALARVYIAEHLTRIQQTEKSAGQPRFKPASNLMQRSNWGLPSGGAVMSCCTAEMPSLALALMSSPARGTGAVACNTNVKSCSGTCRAAWLAITSMMHLLCLLQNAQTSFC